MRSLDWSRTSLGPVERWPQSLRTSVSICLQSRFPILLWWGPELVMLYNDGYRPMLGRTKHPRALGQPGLVCWAEIEDIIGPMLRGVLERGEATWSEDQMLPLVRSGFTEECYFTFSYSPIRDESGGVGGVFCAVTETTAQVVGARRLHTLRELGAATLQAETTVEACARAARVLGESSADLPFARIFLLDGALPGGRLAGPDGAPAGDVWLRPIARVAASGRAELVRDWPAGSEPDTASAAMVLPLTSADRASPIGFLVAGISPRRPFDDVYRGFLDLVAAGLSSALARARAYEEERRRAQALAELDRAKTEFFGNVSHELRTPLTLILGPVEDALRGEGALSGEPLQALHRNARRLLRMVNALLDFSRIEAGRAEARFEPVDLAALTAELASVFRAAIEGAGLALVVDCPALAAPVWVDRQQWEKIVLNLVSNAFKFTFAGAVRVALAAEGDRAVLRVEDSGIGIPAAELPHVFERFHRVEGARSRTHEGTGIGLSLVRELVRLHGGAIDVASEVGRGSTFTVSIPLGAREVSRAGPPSADARPSTDALFFGDEAERWLPGPVPSGDVATLGVAAPPARVGPGAHAGRVLVADDNADMRAYVTRILGDEGFVVEAFASGDATLAAAQAAPPDLVLTDVMMPGLDGFGLLQALRADERTRAVPVVMLSARAGEEARVDGFVAGADDYLAKPFSARELAARTASLIELARRRCESEREALRRSEAALLLEASHRKDELLAMLGHELRNPLAPMRRALQLLDGHVPSGDPSRRFVDILDRHTSTLARLVEDLLDVARLTRGVIELRSERLDVERVVRSAFEAVRPLIDARLHSARLAVPAEAVFVLGDAVRLEQVVVNLLTNAAQYTDSGGHIALTVTGARDEVLIRVRDSGMGIAPEKIGRIFEPFAQAAADLDDSRGGLGVGLTVVKRLVELHGGTITATSGGVGKGAEMVVRLPRAPSVSEPTEHASRRQASIRTW